MRNSTVQRIEDTDDEYSDREESEESHGFGRGVEDDHSICEPIYLKDLILESHAEIDL